MDKPMFSDIAVVGGGMVGATLSLLLARALPELHIVMFEAKPFEVDAQQDAASFDGRSTALAPSSIDVFKSLGLWGDLVSYGTFIERIHVSDRGHAGMAVFNQDDNLDTQGGGQPLGFVIENQGLGLVLYQALSQQNNVTTVSPVSVKTIRPTLQGATLLDAENQPICHCRLVLAVDGANSHLRRALGIAVEEKDYQQSALVANVRHIEPHFGSAYERFTEKGPMALLPRGGSKTAHESALIWTCPQSEIAEVVALSDTDFLSALQERFGYRLGRFTSVSRRAVYPLKRVLAEEQVRSSVALMGNAAHFLHPVAGQGFNLSVRDGLRLASVLQCADDSDESIGSLDVLMRYQNLQASDQVRTAFLSDSFISIFKHNGWFVRFARNFGLLNVELHSLIREPFIDVLAGKATPKAEISLDEHGV